MSSHPPTIPTAVRHHRTGFGVNTTQGVIWLLFLKRAVEQILGQSVSKGNFSKSAKGWTHLRVMSIPATAGTADGLKLLAFTEEASKAVDKVPWVLDRCVVPAFQGYKERPVPERLKEF